MESLTFTLAQIAEKIGVTLADGVNPNQEVNSVKPLAEAGAAHLSFLDNPKYAATAQTTQAGAVFVTPENAHLLPSTTAALLTPTPYVAFAQALALMYPPQLQAGVHSAATVDATATIHPTAYIGAGVVIGTNVTIGARTQITANSTIQHATVGDNCIIHPGAHIGQDGFGFAEFKGQIVKIPQVGSVVIGNNVEIGANTTIDRGALGATTIGDNTKLDNQVQIGHNVTLGKNVRICGQSGIAGSATLGDNCLIGAQSGVAGHITLAPHTSLAARSAMVKSVTTPNQTFAGFPAVPIHTWRRQQAVLARSTKSKEA